MQMKLFALIILAAMITNSYCSSTIHHRLHRRQISSLLDPFGLMEKAKRALVGVKNSLKEAGSVVHMVGEDVAEGVANLMGNKNANNKQAPAKSDLETDDEYEYETPEDDTTLFGLDPLKAANQLREGMLEGILKMMGFNPARFGMMAINALIYVAEMITSSLMGDNRASLRMGAPSLETILTWIPTSASTEVGGILREAQDNSLPSHVITSLATETGNSTACIQLLVCKMAPIIWGMQKTLKIKSAFSETNPEVMASRTFGIAEDDVSTMDTLYDQLPPTEDLVHYGDTCETLFPACPLLKLGGTTEKHTNMRRKRNTTS